IGRRPLAACLLLRGCRLLSGHLTHNLANPCLRGRWPIAEDEHKDSADYCRRVKPASISHHRPPSRYDNRPSSIYGLAAMCRKMVRCVKEQAMDRSPRFTAHCVHGRVLQCLVARCVAMAMTEGGVRQRQVSRPWRMRMSRKPCCNAVG